MANQNNDRVAELEAELAKAQAALEKAQTTGVVSKPVAGKFTVELETPEGKMVKKTYRFKNGRTKTPLADGRKVSSAALIKIANGKKATAKEIEAFPALEEVTQEVAKKRLAYYAQIGASMIEEV